MQQPGVQLQRVAGLGEVVALEVEVAQLVQVADVHLLPADLVVKVEQVDGAAHAVLAVLVRDDGPVLEQPLDQPRHCPHKLEALIAQPRMLLAQLGQRRL